MTWKDALDEEFRPAVSQDLRGPETDEIILLRRNREVEVEKTSMMWVMAFLLTVTRMLKRMWRTPRSRKKRVRRSDQKLRSRRNHSQKSLATMMHRQILKILMHRFPNLLLVEEDERGTLWRMTKMSRG